MEYDDKVIMVDVGEHFLKFSLDYTLGIPDSFDLPEVIIIAILTKHQFITALICEQVN